jgi:hypothetical protein
MSAKSTAAQIPNRTGRPAVLQQAAARLWSVSEQLTGGRCELSG